MDRMSYRREEPINLEQLRDRPRKMSEEELIRFGKAARYMLLRNARAKGKRLGRPRVAVDARRVVALRAEGHSWATIAERLGVGEGTVYRAHLASAKITRQASRGKYAAD